MSQNLLINFDPYLNSIESSSFTSERGKVTRVTGDMIEGYLPNASIGSICAVHPADKSKPIITEVVGLNDRKILMMPLSGVRGIKLGSVIEMLHFKASARVGDALLGRVINAAGEPIDGKGPIETKESKNLYGVVRNPLERPPIREALDLGIRSINSMITVGRGQRMSILAGSGVGKSVLLGMMAKNTVADVNVIALIGERGREVREFIEEILGEEGLKKSVVVCVTSDESALLRMRGAFLATSISEYFAEKGLSVLLTMDSVTRFAMAQREIGLSTGEPPTTKGYTPSVFSLLPKLLERAGTFPSGGSITGLYTVLVEGDDMDDPIGDTVRSIVDGHIQLDRKLANKGHFPAIDVLSSASRVMRAVNDPLAVKLALKMKEYLATYRDAEDLINIGAYQEGNNLKLDKAVRLNESLNAFLRQDVDEVTHIQDCQEILMSFLGNEIE